MNTNVSPEMMAMLDGEMKDIQSKKKGFRQVKIEENDSWLVRYIPFEFGNGSTKPFFLKIANHWIMKHPYFCPRNSAPEAGGDPNAPCQICDAAEAMADDSDKNVRSAGFRGSATQQWLMYCWVMAKELAKNRGEIEYVDDPDELWTPWEYMHTKWGFEEFIGVFRQCANRRVNPVNVLDFINGCNFWAAGTGKGISLRREDPGPIAADATEEQIQEIINFAWSKIKVPTYTALSDEKIEEALIKLEESARATQKPKARNFREANPDDGDLAPQQPRRPQAPAVGSRPSAPASRPSAPSVSRPQAPRVSAPPTRTAPPQEQGQDQEQPQAPSAPAPRVAPPSVTVPRANVAPSVRSAAPTPPPASQEAPSAPKTSLGERLRVRQPVTKEEAPPPPHGGSGANTIDNDQDNVTEEQRDPAPPADVPIDDAPPEVSAQGEAAPAQEAPAPPVPSAPRAPQISSRLRAGIASATQRK